MHHDGTDANARSIRKFSGHSYLIDLSKDSAWSVAKCNISTVFHTGTMLCNFRSGVSSNKPGGNTLAELILRIDGMHCGSCIRRVTQALAASDRLQVEEVRLGAARVQTQDGAEVIDQAIAALAKAGYTARLEQ